MPHKNNCNTTSLRRRVCNGTLDEELANTYPFMSEEDLLKCIVNEKIDSDEITTDEYGIFTLDRPNAFELLVTIEAILN